MVNPVCAFFVYLRYKIFPSLLRQKLATCVLICIPVAVCALCIAVFAPQIPSDDTSSISAELDPPNAIFARFRYDEETEIVPVPDAVLFYVAPMNDNWNETIQRLLLRIYNDAKSVSRHSRRFVDIKTMEGSFFAEGSLQPQCDVALVINESALSNGNRNISYSIQSAFTTLNIKSPSVDPEPENPYVKSINHRIISSGIISLQTWLLEQILAECHTDSDRNFTISSLWNKSSDLPRFQAFPISPSLMSRRMKLKAARGSITRIMAPIFMVCAVVPIFLRSTSMFVIDKEYGLRQYLRINGMPTLAYALASVVEHFFIFGLSALACVGELNGVGLFYSSSFGTIWLLFAVVIVSLTMHGYFFQCFFDSAGFSSLLAFLLYAAEAVLGTSLALCSNEHCTPGLKGFLAFVSPPVNFILSLHTTLGLENEHEGLKSSESFWTRPEPNDVTLGTLLLCAGASWIVYYFVSLYLEEVIPGKLGTPRPFYFPFVSIFNSCCAKKCARSDSLPINAPDRPQDPPNQWSPQEYNTVLIQDEAEATTHCGEMPAVRIRGLRKTFDSFVAVHELSMDMYSGEVISFLGHNGAGKSTTISMLTGLLEPTSGDVHYFGTSLREHPDEVKASIGVCSQHDVIAPNLTSKDHLYLFAALKGVPFSEISNVVMEYSEVLGFGEKIDDIASSLSGGQKRKLAVCIAFLGNTSVVFLDEPTAAMDPVSRRGVWEMVQKNKKDRTIVLTTHFMDEADVLGDRVAIIHHGQLRCFGTSLFLKNRLGVGYTLSVTGVPRSAHSSIVNEIQGVCSDASVRRSAGGELVMTIPFTSSETVSLLRLLESNNNLSDKFTFMMTTLEELFLRLAYVEDSVEEGASMAPGSTTEMEIPPSATSLDLPPDSLLLSKTNTGCSRVFKQFAALLYKRVCVFRHDYQSIAFQVIFPCIFLIAGLVAYNILIGKVESSAERIHVLTEAPIWSAPGQIIGYSNSSSPATPELAALASHVPQIMNVTCCYGNVAELLKNQSLSIPTLLPASVGAWDVLRWERSLTSLDASVKFFFDRDKEAIVVSEVHHFFVGLGGLIASITNSSKEIGIKGDVSQIPSNPIVNKILPQILLTLFMSMSFAFIPASYAAFVVREREVNSLFLQLASGVPRLVYWFAAICWDCVMTLFFCAVCILGMFLALTKFPSAHDAAMDNLDYEAVFTAFFAYVLCATLLTYSFSLFFDRYASAQICIALGFLSLNVTFAISMVSVALSVGPGEEATVIVALVFASIHPLFALTFILWLHMNVFGLGSGQMQRCGTSLTSFCVSGQFMFILWMQTSGLALLLVLHQLPWTSWGRCCVWFCCASGHRLRPAQGYTDPEDVDVVAEKERARLAASQTDVIEALVVDEIRKTFDDFKAVDGVSFVIPRGECFGLLGSNGAGKTTCLKMLTAEMIPSGGVAYVNGSNILSSPSAVQESIGLDPQFDALLGEMTGFQTLFFYGLLKGLPLGSISEVADAFVSHVGLVQYRDIPSRSYSGGNRRKLSLAVALIGSPDVVFLDEPSAGMDAAARRKVWNVIQCAAVHGQSVILTSHNMAEAEALCDRVGIMTGGRLHCIGSSAHLRNKFSVGFHFEVVCGSADHIDNVRNWVLETFPGATELEQNVSGLRMKFSLPASLKLSNIFERVLSKRSTDPDVVVDFAVSHTTLENVFFHIVNRDDTTQPQTDSSVRVPEVPAN